MYNNNPVTAEEQQFWRLMNEIANIDEEKKDQLLDKIYCIKTTNFLIKQLLKQ